MSKVDKCCEKENQEKFKIFVAVDDENFTFLTCNFQETYQVLINFF